MSRLIGFELQFGPDAVAQLRLGAEIEGVLDDDAPMPDLRLFVTNTLTLSTPSIEAEQLPTILKDLSISRRKANEIKRSEPIAIVIGNAAIHAGNRTSILVSGRGVWVWRARRCPGGR